ncbi:hypothetical protein MVEN_02321500 [Mycena venus]|uniref:Uncharacterized protein n=1 Tax=Mycena venus TaxID=2733690 RepID=A0A8H6X4M2_9AGAR|nr:hypothetical protein MVEN_02321500 [Mycena venus]
MVWEELLPESKKDHKQAEKDYPKVLQAWKQKVREAEQAGKPLPAKPKQPVARMQEGEDLNFLRFSTFLRMIIGTTISKTPQARRRITQLPQDFLLEFLQLCEADSCKPNLHWAIHVPEQIRDFGPLHGFWAFLPERLNKVLKNTNSNNWTGGRLEVSMMREFQWVVVMHTVLDKLKISHDISAVEQRAISFLLGTATIGTVQDAARSRSSLCSRVVPGTIAKGRTRIEDDHLRVALFNHYSSESEHWLRVHYPNVLPATITADSLPLGSHADFLNFALLDGRRIVPATRARRQSESSSLVQLKYDGDIWVGRVEYLVRHHQEGLSESPILAYISWMQESRRTPLNGDRLPWSTNFPELGIESWECAYRQPNRQDGPRSIQPLTEIQCQVARGTVTHMIPKMWMTVALDRFPEHDMNGDLEEGFIL